MFFPIHRFLPAEFLLALVAIPAVAFGAAKPGTYKGTSSGKYIQVGQAEEPTHRREGVLHREEQQGAELQGEEAVGPTRPAGRGPGNHQDDQAELQGEGLGQLQGPRVFGTLKVTITVTSAGKAKGIVRKPPSATGLCDSDFPVRFNAKRG